MIDTHIHIDGEEFKEDLAEVVQRAKDAGCEMMFVPAINLESLTTVPEVCSQYPDFMFPMMGLHPEDVKEDWQEVLAKMKEAWPAKLEKEAGFVFGPWGYYVAMAVVEKVTGEPFDAVMRREFLDPLGLQDTVFMPSPEQMDRMAPDIPPYKWLTVPYDSKERRAAPDCGLFSTKADLEKFARALLSDERMDSYTVEVRKRDEERARRALRTTA